MGPLEQEQDFQISNQKVKTSSNIISTKE